MNITQRRGEAILEQRRENANRPPLISEEYVPRTMPAVLGQRDVFFMYLCALFLLTNAVIGASGGTISLLYLILGAILFFVPCVVIAAQLGVLMPHEGALYNWTYHALGTYWALFVSLLYWVTGMLAVVTAGGAFVTVLQGLNNAWLPEPWQQGLVILGLIVVGNVVAMQRMRTTQNIINTAMTITLLAVALVTGAAIFWLLKGHPAQSSFAHASDWSINPSNFFFFGIVTLSFIGTSGPLNMAGEFKGAISNEPVRRSIITQHLLVGSLVVFLLYFLVSLAVLIVRGPTNMNHAVVLPFEAFTAIDTTLGKVIGDIAICCFLFYCVAASIFYSMASSRILMVAAIDHRIPIWFGRLNKARVPGNALLFQILFTSGAVCILYIIAPYLVKVGNNAATTLAIFYTILSASTTLVWTLATCFFFINFVFLYRSKPQWFHRIKILPVPLLWLCTVVGGLACLLTIVGILFYPWIPLLTNSQWLPYVGGLALATVLIAGVGSLFANSEASWEAFEQGATDDA